MLSLKACRPLLKHRCGVRLLPRPRSAFIALVPRNDWRCIALGCFPLCACLPLPRPLMPMIDGYAAPITSLKVSFAIVMYYASFSAQRLIYRDIASGSCSDDSAAAAPWWLHLLRAAPSRPAFALRIVLRVYAHPFLLDCCLNLALTPHVCFLPLQPRRMAPKQAKPDKAKQAQKAKVRDQNGCDVLPLGASKQYSMAMACGVLLGSCCAAFLEGRLSRPQLNGAQIARFGSAVASTACHPA